MGTTMFAQSLAEDKELTMLLDVVKMLRVTNETTYNKALEILKNDSQWTPMDETGAVRADVECKASEKVPGFKLNRILTKVDSDRIYVSTHGDFVNGTSAKYDYSLYERALKPNKEVAYRLKGREGQQVFVLVPYNCNAKFEVTVQSGGKTAIGTRNQEGIVVVEFCDEVKSDNYDFVVKVRNTMRTSQSFVIINHNTRKK